MFKDNPFPYDWLFCQQLWDNNDTVLESEWYAARINGAMGTEEQEAAEKAATHANTPTILHTDTLARAFYTIQDDGINPLIHSYEVLDIQGNRLSVVDGRGLTPLTYAYNMLQAPCWQKSVDKGTTTSPNNNVERTFTDVAGQLLYAWDADDRMFEHIYDELRRLTKRKVTENSVTKTLEVYAYGEGETDDKIKNIRGAVFKIYDGAGKITIPEYDFKGNPLNTTRIYALDKTQHPDWTIIDDLNLETTTYPTIAAYDALNRPKQQTTPDNAITSYSYDKGGLLKTVVVDNVHSLNTDVVNNIAYDAKGQRTKIQYENGTTTTYEYDAFTFKVRRIRTTRHSDSKELQDLRYWYDPIGNITLQKDLAQQAVYFDGTVAEPNNDYTYDALYRLIQAEGREHAGNNTASNHNDNSRVNITPVPIASADAAKMRRYIQYYEYDAVGNFIEMRHTVTGGTGNWTRTYNTASSSNRMLSTIVSSVTETYSYDNRGNIIGGMNHLNAGAASMVYNAENRLEKVIIDANQTAYYQYDNNGQRVRKTIINSSANKTKVRKYIGEWEVFSEFNSSSLAIDIERETLHISDGTGRIALNDTPTENNTGSSETQLLRYQYSNHLGSATLELDHVGAVISYEEYYPYGSTSFQSGRSAAEVSLKRYRYTGKERDEESGLYYHGARYYVPWLARWTACDPINSENHNLQKGYGLEKNKERDFLELTASPYEYCYDNPVRFNDPNGEQVPSDINVGIKAGIGITLGKTNNNISFNINATLAHSENNFSQEYTLGGSYTIFSRVNNFKAEGTGLTIIGSALFGAGQNSDLAGSAIVGGISMYDSSGNGGFNGAGIGFTAISLTGPATSLSNLSWNILGRFTVGGGSLGINVMEDLFLSDRGATGSTFFTYTKGLSNNQSFSVGIANETYTDKAVKSSSKEAKSTDLGRNMVKGKLYWTKYVTGAPSYGTNALTVGFNNPTFNLATKVGLYGGKQGAATQNFIHLKITEPLFGEQTPLFNHDRSYFGRLFMEMSLIGAKPFIN